MKHGLFAWILVATATTAASAQIVAPSGRTLFNDGLLVRSVVRLDEFRRSGNGTELSRLTGSTAVVWGVRPHTSLSLVVPVVRTSRRVTGSSGTEATTGTGDAALFARYDLVRRNVPGGYTRFAPELGVKLPTGGAAGTGSTDVVAGLVLSHVRDPDWRIVDLQATVPGTGDHGLRAGERWRFDVAYLRRLLPRPGPGTPMLLGVLELNVETVEETRRNGAVLTDTGGDVVYFSPGVEYVASRRLVLEASLPLPVHHDLGAARAEPKVSLILGLRWLF